jgi:UDP-N-acetylglucosamine--N-acetylmuramyl-(pentapeptide) pyrophosphoryl-undecaprenol N-acetylglucosamine transferase
MTGSRHFILAAGGTGGHMVPAHALGHELMLRGHRISLITDARGERHADLFAEVDRHVIPAATIGGNPLRWLPAWLKIRAGRRAALQLFRDKNPAAVVGFGGYPVLPAMLAAVKAGIPTLIHEQNAVLGRVNRVLARRVDAIATSFPETAQLTAELAGKVTLVGNPVREAIAAIGRAAYPAFATGDVLRILVTGGSLGASVFADVVPDALGQLVPDLRHRLQVTQQCREEDIDRVRTTYRALGIPADLATYIDDMPAALARAHLVIARAGASTVSELAAAGRPSILVPLPIATDDHQAANTRELVGAGGARMVRQSAFVATPLARQIEKIALEPGALANAARRALSVGRADAGPRLASLVERLGGVPLPLPAATEGAAA